MTAYLYILSTWTFLGILWQACHVQAQVTMSIQKDEAALAVINDDDTAWRYVTLNEGDDIQFQCSSDSSSVDCDAPTLITATYIRFNESSASSRIGSESADQSCSLTLTGLKYFDTGPLMCRDSNDESVEPSASNSIYLFVTSAEHLTLPVKPYSVKKNFRQYYYCFPTSPDTIVDIQPQSDFPGPPSPSPSGNIFEGYSLAPTIGPASRFKPLQICSISAEDRNPEITRFVTIDEPENPYVRVVPSQNYFLVGETLHMNCTFQTNAPAQLQWLPHTLRGDGRFSNVTTASSSNEIVSRATLTNLRTSDTGNYTCLYEAFTSNKNASYTISIIVYDSAVLTLQPISQTPIIAMTGQASIVVIYTVTAYPMPDIVWRKSQQVISGSNRIMITNPHVTNVGSFLDHNITLQIRNVEPGDAGNYSITASIPNGNLNAIKNFVIVVHEIPPNKLTYKSDGVAASFPASDDDTRLYFKPGNTIELVCKSTGYPAPKITWRYQNCQLINCPRDSNWLDPADAPSLFHYSVNSSNTLTLSVKTTSTAWFQCQSSNTAGTQTSEVLLNVSAVAGGRGFNRNNGEIIPLVVNDPLTLQCYASKFECAKDDVKIMEQSDQTTTVYDRSTSPIALLDESDLNSYILTLTIDSVTLDMDKNRYICRCADLEGSTTSLSVQTYLAPSFNRSVSGEVKLNVGQTRSFYCEPLGRPLPEITWYRNGKLIAQSTSEISLSPNRYNLTISRVTLSEAGTYTCVATTKHEGLNLNSTFSLTVEKVDSQPALASWHIAMIVVMLIIFLVSAVLLTLYCTRRHCRKKYIPHGLLLPSKDMINPDIPLDEQTDALPYEVSWEFPPSKLILGQLLGQGAFGRVLKAEAVGIEPGVAATTVAVKTTRDSSDIEQVKALISELKILIHIGQHLNIVNLMGACTKEVSKGNLMVIVEFCRHGNLRTYLLKHKSHYNPTLEDITGSEKISVQITGGADQDDYLNEGPSDLHSQQKPVTGRDLLCWSFQIARGMDYLASIDYIHRDLAARNVLLADDNVVKICDFGLAKDIYKYQEYQKKTDGPLPIKWMALESLTHKVFNTRTDVWAYGVTLWELFSIAATPYPGVELDETFIDRLEAGYRMEKPRHSPDDVYHLMLQTWHPDADRRPTFEELSDILGGMLSEDDRKHYEGLEDPYLQTQASRTDIKLRTAPGRKRGIEDFDSNYLMTSRVGIRPNGSANDYENTRASTSQKNRNWRDTDGRSDEKLPLQVSIDDETDMPTSMAPSPAPWQRQPHLKPPGDADTHSHHSADSEGHRPPSYNYVMKNGQPVPINDHELTHRQSAGTSSRRESFGDDQDESRPFIETSC